MALQMFKLLAEAQIDRLLVDAKSIAKAIKTCNKVEKVTPQIVVETLGNLDAAAIKQFSVAGCVFHTAVQRKLDITYVLAGFWCGEVVLSKGLAYGLRRTPVPRCESQTGCYQNLIKMYQNVDPNTTRMEEALKLM